jgi:dihydrofolate synthase/folylpolyglutamate synthase
VGLGGRLDAVNILDADISVVTSIGLDHMDWLGSDREQIAVEKAGVARAGKPCIVADSEPPRSLLASLEKLGSVSLVVNHEWHIDHGELHMASGARYELPRVDGLLPQNVAAAVQALEAGQFCTLSQGLLDQLSDLAVPGRRSLHRLGSVEVLLDVAHNVEAVAELVQLLNERPVSGATVALFGVMGDKPIRDMIRACESVFDEWNLIDLSHVPRAMETHYLVELLSPTETVRETGCFADLWDAVLARGRTGDRIVVFGSFFSVAEAIQLLAAQRDEGSGGR